MFQMKSVRVRSLSISSLLDERQSRGLNDAWIQKLRRILAASRLLNGLSK